MRNDYEQSEECFNWSKATRLAYQDLFQPAKDFNQLLTVEDIYIAKSLGIDISLEIKARLEKLAGHNQPYS